YRAVALRRARDWIHRACAIRSLADRRLSRARSNTGTRSRRRGTRSRRRRTVSAYSRTPASMLARGMSAQFSAADLHLRFGGVVALAGVSIDVPEIEHIRKRVVGTLPYGLQKRVELGRALAVEPLLLLLDEPMAGMNLEEKEDMARFVLDINEERGVTVVLIEHDMGVVMDI